ncbi:haloacid dehalogenase type II [Marinomonas pollencensis]|uniref:(S)-2-haloacid dehalogenase n=1 Tax=Marinomonas pollencensis TaxID=491954 RepID=A0A3E0DQ34_9GAMM|nr:haloacid dehalogenase type II [Marinomonas pollencensis]REG84352.1 2-haloacid dehalogenase [Marinomonas pollencensis]
MTQKTILFDINETVLNLETLKPKFKAAFGDDGVMSLWFASLLHSSTVCVATQVKTDFAALAGVVLDAVAVRKGVALSAPQRDDILTGFASLPPHDDIQPALQRLKSAGFRCVAFSNSSLNLIATQINNAGLSEVFDDILSVESTGSFKPDPKAYQFAAETLGLPLAELRLVATHDWDTHGALSAGMKAAYIARTPALYHPLYRSPDIHGNHMGDIVDKIIAVECC